MTVARSKTKFRIFFPSEGETIADAVEVLEWNYQDAVRWRLRDLQDECVGEFAHPDGLQVAVIPEGERRINVTVSTNWYPHWTVERVARRKSRVPVTA